MSLPYRNCSDQIKVLPSDQYSECLKKVSKNTFLWKYKLLEIPIAGIPPYMIDHLEAVLDDLCFFVEDCKNQKSD